MLAKINIRTSALGLLAAAALSTAAGIASSAQASLAASSHMAAAAIVPAGEHSLNQDPGGRGHRLPRPANRLQGSAKPAAPR